VSLTATPPVWWTVRCTPWWHPWLWSLLQLPLVCVRGDVFVTRSPTSDTEVDACCGVREIVYGRTRTTRQTSSRDQQVDSISAVRYSEETSPFRSKSHTSKGLYRDVRIQKSNVPPCEREGVIGTPECCKGPRNFRTASLSQTTSEVIVQHLPLGYNQLFNFDLVQ
jgi:hypothetical protein